MTSSWPDLDLTFQLAPRIALSALRTHALNVTLVTIKTTLANPAPVRNAALDALPATMGRPAPNAHPPAQHGIRRQRHANVRTIIIR